MKTGGTEAQLRSREGELSSWLAVLMFSSHLHSKLTCTRLELKVEKKNMYSVLRDSYLDVTC